VGPVDDQVCLNFSQNFYDRLLGGSGIQSAFNDTIALLNARKFKTRAFRLDRRSLITRKEGRFLECVPDPKRDSILINLDDVADDLTRFGMPEEELCHLIAKKLKIHCWIFDVPREGCIIPIGQFLYGEFEWCDAKDVVYCRRLMKLRSDIPLNHWRTWHRLLLSYNDLASSSYRLLDEPASPQNREALERALELFQHNVERYLKPARAQIAELGFDSILPQVEFVISHCEMAADHLGLDRNRQVVKSLEEALTNYHEIIDGLRPPVAPE